MGACPVPPEISNSPPPFDIMESDIEVLNQALPLF